MSLAKTEEKREKIRNGDGKAKASSGKKSVWLLEDDDLDTGEEPSNALQELAYVKKNQNKQTPRHLIDSWARLSSYHPVLVLLALCCSSLPLPQNTDRHLCHPYVLLHAPAKSVSWASPAPLSQCHAKIKNWKFAPEAVSFTLWITRL